MSEDGEFLARKYCELVNTDAEACARLFAEDSEYIIRLRGKSMPISRHRLAGFLRSQQGLECQFAGYEEIDGQHKLRYSSVLIGPVEKRTVEVLVEFSLEAGLIKQFEIKG